MPKTDPVQSTTTSLSSVPLTSVTAVSPDQPDITAERRWSFTDASANLGYYKTIPQYNAVTKAMATYTVALGIETDPRQQTLLERIQGAGGEGFQDVLFNMEVMKKALGDAMAEIIRDDNGAIINLKPLWLGNMTVVYDGKGIIKHYEDSRKPGAEILPEKIFHISNDRIANEMHGNPSSSPLKWIIEAKQEAMEDWRKISHRSSIRILYVAWDDTEGLTRLRNQYKEGVKNKDVLILTVEPGEAKFEDLQLPPVEAFLAWIRYLDNLFYQTSGVPKIIATSEDYTEAAGKVGFLTFQPFYTKEMQDMESALWNQMAIKIKFVKPPQLGGMMQKSEEANTGQTGIQPSDTEVDMERNE